MSELRHVQGLAELEKTLRQLPVKLETKILRGALRAGAAVFSVEVSARLPRKSGKLASTLRISTAVRRGVVSAKVVVGDSKKKGVFYAHMLEGGTKPHFIKAKPGKSLRLYGGRMVKRVTHPGIRPRPFMGPAFKAGTTAALEAVAAYIRQRLDQVVK
jgi:HK97 gp10 family phage protein